MEEEVIDIFSPYCGIFYVSCQNTDGGIIKKVNKAVANIYGWSKVEIEGMNVAQITPDCIGPFHD